MKKISFIFAFLTIFSLGHIFAQNTLMQKIQAIRSTHFQNFGYDHSLPLGTKTQQKLFGVYELGKRFGAHHALVWATPIIVIDEDIYDSVETISNALNILTLNDIAGIAYVNEGGAPMYGFRGNFGVIHLYTKTYIQTKPNYLTRCQYKF
jgi:hypothetical protein